MNFLLDRLKREILSKKIYIIGIDGLGGAGKSTKVHSLKKQLESENYPTFVIHIDDFIHPKHIRYDQSREEWDCYYNLQWRYDYLVKELLAPIKRGDILDKQIELYNKETDTYDLEDIYIPHGSVLILEGIFLQRKELRHLLDFIIYIHVPRDVRLNRVLTRDSYIGDKDAVKQKYEHRYFPAEERYISDYNPTESADILISQ